MNELKKSNIQMNDDLIVINDNIEKIKYKINVINDKNTFVNYKKYFDKFCEVYLHEKEIDMYNKLNNDIVKKSKNNEMKKIINIQVDKVTTIMNKEKNELDKIIKYKNDYEIIGSDENYNDQLDDLIKQKNDIINKIKHNDHEIENYFIYEENKNLEKQIINIKKNITKENKKNNKYEEYVGILNEYEDYEKKVNQLKLKSQKQINENLKKENDMNKYIKILEKIEKNDEKLKKYYVIKTEYENIITISKNIKNNFEIIKKEKNDIDSTNKIMSDKIIISKEIIKKCNELIDDLNNFKIISNSLSNDGLGDKILKEQIVVKLQETIDSTCIYIGHEKININIINKSDNSYKKYDILIGTERCKDVANAGGFQYNIIELIFKLAFLKINCYFKSSFIIIDEIFDACSNENKDMAIKLIDFFGSQYDKILLVSHNHTIINTFDKRLVITKDTINGNSILQS
jgi:DNA repair exonuclease SbcCD ATPase subunit